MDTLTNTFVLILLAVGVLLVIEVSFYSSSRKYLHKGRDEDWEREARREELRELHRIRRQRDRVWFRMDKLYGEFVQRTSGGQTMMEAQRREPPSRTSDVEADSWNDVNLTYIKEKYESFLKKG